MIPGPPDSATVAAEKRSLRSRIQAGRDQLTPLLRGELSAAITARLIARLDVDRPRVVSSFVSFGSEFDTGAFNAAVLSRGTALVLPRIRRAERCLDLLLVADLARDLVPGVWGILEPDPRRCISVDISAVDWCVVPGLAFDRSGRRVGYGAGFYDRLLSAGHCLKVAPAFQLQLVDRVPTEPHDRCVDFVVTESETVTARA